MKRRLARVKLRRPTKRDGVIVALILLGAVAQFGLMNAAVAGIFMGKSYPLTSIAGVKVGNMTSGEISAQTEAKLSLPSEISLNHRKTVLKTSPTVLGVQLDHPAMGQAALQRRGLPLTDAVMWQILPLELKIDQTKFDAELKKITSPLNLPASNARIITEKSQFAILPESNGTEVKLAQTKALLLSELRAGRASSGVVTTVLSPKIIAKNLEKQRDELNQQAQSNITFTFQDKASKASAAEITAWYGDSGSSMMLVPAKVEAHIRALASSWNITVTNLPAAVEAAQKALVQKSSTSVVLQGTVNVTPPKHYSYCVSARNVDAALLADLSQKLRSVFADGRGWSLGGQVRFSEVQQGCQFTIWLSAADQLPAFSSGCSTEWSCRVGSNVIFNVNRWQDSSASWRAAGGNLDEYRSMLINHEVGHWLGFDHFHCGGPGQPAPVMQQQSIDLEGCAFNAWPLEMEKVSLRGRLGV